MLHLTAAVSLLFDEAAVHMWISFNVNVLPGPAYFNDERPLAGAETQDSERQQRVDTGNAVLLTADGHAHRSSCERRTRQVQASWSLREQNHC